MTEHVVQSIAALYEEVANIHWKLYVEHTRLALRLYRQGEQALSAKLYSLGEKDYEISLWYAERARIRMQEQNGKACDVRAESARLVSQTEERSS